MKTRTNDEVEIYELTSDNFELEGEMLVLKGISIEKFREYEIVKVAPEGMEIPKTGGSSMFIGGNTLFFRFSPNRLTTLDTGNVLISLYNVYDKYFQLTEFYL